MCSQLRQTNTIEEPPTTIRSKQSLRAGKAATGYPLRSFARTEHHHAEQTKGEQRYSYPQPTIKSWLPPLAQYSVGTVAQYSIGADSLELLHLLGQYPQRSVEADAGVDAAHIARPDTPSLRAPTG